MGDLLLKGWKMLGENCPETGETPLMQHPTNGRKFSIATGRYTDEQAEAMAKAEADYTTILKKEPNNSGLYHRRGVVRFFQLKFDDSLADFNKFIEKEGEEGYSSTSSSPNCSTSSSICLIKKSNSFWASLLGSSFL